MSEEKTTTTVNANREGYTKSKSASGSASLHNGDPVATACEGMTIEDMFKMAKRMTGEDYSEKYAKLNVGMQRMNLGNRIRGAISKLNKAGSSPKEGEEANPNAGDEKFAQVSTPFVERTQKRIAKEAEAKAKKEKEKAQKAESKGEAA